MGSIVKVIRSVLRENVRRTREGLIPLRKTVPTSARIGNYPTAIPRNLCWFSVPAMKLIGWNVMEVQVESSF